MNRREAADFLDKCRWWFEPYNDEPDKWHEAIDLAIEALSADDVPIDQYKKGFEDAKRAFLVEYARESENMRKRNAQLEVMLNVQKVISADSVQGCDGCRYNTPTPQKQCLRCKRYWRDGYERKGGEDDDRP